jgi:signal peptidase I
MMGDNRDNSADSRDMQSMGFVPNENVEGKARWVFFSIEEGARVWEFWKWPWSIRWNRLFTSIT